VRGESKQSLEVLVKWKNIPDCENSWESMTKMIEAFPNLHLKDKVNFKEGGFDTSKELGGHIRKTQKVYERVETNCMGTTCPHTLILILT